MNFIELDDDVEASQAGELAASLDTLTKANIASLLYQRMGINKRESRELVEAFFEEIRAELMAGRDVKISGFGNFEVRKKTPRPGRNPRTGELVPIAARTIVSFHASLKLKAQVSSQHPATDFLL
jgi:integration host factor subunit alpha